MPCIDALLHVEYRLRVAVIKDIDLIIGGSCRSDTSNTPPKSIGIAIDAEGELYSSQSITTALGLL